MADNHLHQQLTVRYFEATSYTCMLLHLNLCRAEVYHGQSTTQGGVQTPWDSSVTLSWWCELRQDEQDGRGSGTRIAPCNQTLIVARFRTMDTTIVATSLDRLSSTIILVPAAMTPGEGRLEVRCRTKTRCPPIFYTRPASCLLWAAPIMAATSTTGWSIGLRIKGAQ